MKELDRAIVNNDIEQINFLIKEGIDCTGAVFIHLKDALVPDSFSEEQLVEKGAILTLDALKIAIAGYFDASQLDFRQEGYLKRVFLGVQELRKSFQQGTIQNQEAEEMFNQESIDFLDSQWVNEKLPESLTQFAEEKQAAYIKFKCQQWHEGALDERQMQILDDLIQDSLLTRWHHTDTQVESDPFVNQIKENIIEQLVNYYHDGDENDEAVEAIENFLCKLVMEKVIDNSIGKEAIKDAVEQEKRIALGDKVAIDHTMYYKEGIKALFTKWRATGKGLENRLDSGTEKDVKTFVLQQLKNYQLPTELKNEVLNRAIAQFLMQYKNNLLIKDVMEDLSKQFTVNITGYYEQQALKQTDFHVEVSKVIFSELLSSWKEQTLETCDTNYLQANLLAGIQRIQHDLGVYVSRSSMYLLMREMQGKVMELTAQVMILKGEDNAVDSEDQSSSLLKSAVLLNSSGIFSGSSETPSTEVAEVEEKVETKVLGQKNTL